MTAYIKFHMCIRTTSLVMELVMSSTHDPVKGRRPNTKQYRQTPRAHTSEVMGSSVNPQVRASGGWKAGVQDTLLEVEVSLIILQCVMCIHRSS